MRIDSMFAEKPERLKCLFNLLFFSFVSAFALFQFTTGNSDGTAEYLLAKSAESSTEEFREGLLTLF